MNAFTPIFEQAVPRWLSTCVNFTEELEGLNHIWVVHQDDDGASVTAAAYKVGSQIYSAQGLTFDLGHRSVDELQSYLRELVDVTWSFYEVEPSEMPRRIVVRYDVVAESMDAEFTFDEIIPAECEIPDNRVMDLWIDRLKASGDDSAVMVMTPEQMKLYGPLEFTQPRLRDSVTP